MLETTLIIAVLFFLSAGAYALIKKQEKQIAANVKVIKQLKGAGSVAKGQLGEFAHYLRFTQLYDRMIPLNSITDFLCVKFDGEEAGLHFVEIKTGQHARLSADQVKFKKLIKDKQVFFHTLKRDILIGGEDSED